MKKLCIALIRFYQRVLSPRKRTPTCRFTPTCSAYAIEAFEKRGFFAGLILTVYRILRGETSPDSVTLDLLEEALGLTVPPATGLDAHALACRTCRQSYNRQLAEKELWIKREFIVCLILVAFVCLILIVDIAIPTAGWVRG